MRQPIESETILSGAGAATTSVVSQFSGSHGSVIYIESSAAITNGTLLIEEAASAAYAGAWTLLDTIDENDLGGAAKCATLHLSALNVYDFIRFRISEIFEGGTITIRVRKRY